MYGLDSSEYEQMTRRDRFAEMLAGVRRFAELRQSGTELVLGFRLLKSRSREDLANWIREQFGVDLAFAATTTYANWGVLNTSQPLPGDASWMKIRYNKGQCAIPLLASQISSDGDVSFCPCDDFQGVGELKLGNVRDATLLSMYNTEKVARLYDFASEVPKFCRSCSFWQPLENSEQVADLCRDPINSIGG